MLVTLLMYAYVRGVLSSRAVEDRCRYDATFRLVCGSRVPDHVTVSRFRKWAFGQQKCPGCPEPLTATNATRNCNRPLGAAKLRVTPGL